MFGIQQQTQSRSSMTASGYKRQFVIIGNTAHGVLPRMALTLGIFVAGLTRFHKGRISTLGRKTKTITQATASAIVKLYVQRTARPHSDKKVIMVVGVTGKGLPCSDDLIPNTNFVVLVDHFGGNGVVGWVIVEILAHAAPLGVVVLGGTIDVRMTADFSAVCALCRVR